VLGACILTAHTQIVGLMKPGRRPVAWHVAASAAATLALVAGQPYLVYNKEPQTDADGMQSLLVLCLAMRSLSCLLVVLCSVMLCCVVLRCVVLS
jgi:hypothetical protein